MTVPERSADVSLVSSSLIVGSLIVGFVLPIVLALGPAREAARAG